MSASHLEAKFPRLQASGYTITSPSADQPNCIGWVLRSNLYFDPGLAGFMAAYYWPPGIRRDESLAAWTELFALHQYQECDTTELEPETEKIAIYGDAVGEAWHVARQLPSGVWTSKLGKLEDIEHRTLDALTDSEYGTVVKIVRRRRLDR